MRLPTPESQPGIQGAGAFSCHEFGVFQKAVVVRQQKPIVRRTASLIAAAGFLESCHNPINEKFIILVERKGGEMPLALGEPRGVPLLSGGRDAKSLIVGVLAKEFPLSAKEIHRKIVKAEPSVKLTYQAVHKALGQLESSGVVLNNGGFRLRSEWVEGLKGFGDDLFKKYVKKTPLEILDVHPYSAVETLWDGQYIQPYWWMLEQTYKAFKANGVPARVVFFMRRCWPPTVVGEKEREEMAAMYVDRGNQYVLCDSASPVDKLLASFWVNYGFKTKNGVSVASGNDTYVFQDFVFQIFDSVSTKKAWDRLYSLIEKSNCRDLSPTHNLAFEIEAKTRIVVTRNKELADNLRYRAQAVLKEK